MRRLRAAAALCGMGVALGACQSPSSPSGSDDTVLKSASLRAMEQVGKAAYSCWFASKDPAFRPYSFANELNSMSGQPRFLLVPARNFGGKPLLVVQASGASSRVEAFGPLLDGPIGGRIKADLARWSAGATTCGATA